MDWTKVEMLFSIIDMAAKHGPEYSQLVAKARAELFEMQKGVTAEDSAKATKVVTDAVRSMVPARGPVVPIENNLPITERIERKV